MQVEFCLKFIQITWSCKRFVEAAKCKPGQEAVVSYLPLANITSQILDIYAMIACAGSCWFAQPDALQVGSMCSVMQRSIMQRSIISFPTRARYCRL